METNNNPTEERDQNENLNPKKEEKKSWFERNAWAIALCIALFLVRMCSELSRR